MKTGLVVEGGGMKCAYSAGILDKFLDDNITFSYCIGVSAGAANTLSYRIARKNALPAAISCIFSGYFPSFNSYSLL